MKQKQKTVKRSQLTNCAMISGGEKKISRVILDGTVRNWVGIGWVDEGKPTTQQQKELPTVID